MQGCEWMNGWMDGWRTYDREEHVRGDLEDDHTKKHQLVTEVDSVLVDVDGVRESAC